MFVSCVCCVFFCKFCERGRRGAPSCAATTERTARKGSARRPLLRPRLEYLQVRFRIQFGGSPSFPTTLVRGSSEHSLVSSPLTPVHPFSNPDGILARRRRGACRPTSPARRRLVTRHRFAGNSVDLILTHTTERGVRRCVGRLDDEKSLERGAKAPWLFRSTDPSSPKERRHIQGNSRPRYSSVAKTRPNIVRMSIPPKGRWSAPASKGTFPSSPSRPCDERFFKREERERERARAGGSSSSSSS